MGSLCVDVVARAEQKLRPNQKHLLPFLHSLDEPRRIALAEQIDQLDFELLDKYKLKQECRNVDLPEAEKMEAPEVFDPRDPGNADLRRRALACGNQLLADGKVACFVVAGGQSSRLGVSCPKGCVSVTPVKNKSLFQVFAERILQKSSGCPPVPWYIMTSEANDAETREFFAENGYFRLNAENVFFFSQRMLPALSIDGKLLLAASKDSLVLAPDGHGGSLSAAYQSGALDDMKKRGIEVISYFQVDNPMVNVLDPLFLGLHVLNGSDMSLKVIPKCDPHEKLGNVVLIGGRTKIIEYCDMPSDVVELIVEGSAGSLFAVPKLKFSVGSIGIHVLSVAFVERLNQGGHLVLPFHRAKKFSEHWDCVKDCLVCRDTCDGAPNSVKFEKFVFDALHFTEKPVTVLETVRGREFGPVKNAHGADSLDSSRLLQIDYAAHLVESFTGLKLLRNDDGHVCSDVEVSPLSPVAAFEEAERFLPAVVNSVTSEVSKKLEVGGEIYVGTPDIRFLVEQEAESG